MTFDTPQEREAFILANEGLVFDVVSKMPRSRRIERDDMINSGYVALIRAVDGFDPGRGKFSTYAFNAIRRTLFNILDETTRIGKVPRNVPTLYARHLRGEKLSQREKECVKEYLRAKRSHGAADAFNVARHGDDYWESVDRQHEQAIRSIDSLDEYSRDVLRRRFGLDGGRPRMWGKIGRELRRCPQKLAVQVFPALLKVRREVRGVA